jgi:hypothetical protein
VRPTTAPKPASVPWRSRVPGYVRMDYEGGLALISIAAAVALFVAAYVYLGRKRE